MSNVAKLKKRALEYEQKKQIDKALDTYLQLLGMLGEHVDEVDVALYNRVGDLMLRQGNVAAALDHYERAVDLYAEGGFFNNATALCNKILRNAPGRSSIYYKLGRISAKNGFINDARQNFLEYADRMQRLGQIDEAFRALKEFADLCPDQDDIRLMLADQLVKVDRKAEAIDQLQFLFEKYQAEGRTSEAHATLERMKAIDPDLRPKQGVVRPSPKVNDLIFLDVNYDDPGQVRNGAASHATRSGSSPVAAAVPSSMPTAQPPNPPATSARQVEQPAAIEPAEDLAGSMLPLLEVDFDPAPDVAPLEGLSSGATLGDGYDAAEGNDGVISHVDAALIAGLEETSLGVDAPLLDTIEPIVDIEYTAHPVVDGEGQTVVEPDVFEPDTPANGLEPDAPAVDEVQSATDLDSAVSAGFRTFDGGLDPDDVPETSANELTLILPDDGADSWVGVPPEQTADREVVEQQSEWRVAAQPTAEPAAEPQLVWPATDDSQRFEPLLQLPEVGLASDIDANLDIEQPIETVSLPEPEFESQLEPADVRQPDRDADIAPEAQPAEPEPEPEPESVIESEAAQDPIVYSEVAPDMMDVAVASESVDATAAPGADGVGDVSDILDSTVASDVVELTGLEYLDIGTTLREHESSSETELRDVDRLRAAAERAPEDWELRRRLGEALLEEGDRRGALAEFEAAMLGFERAGDLRSGLALVDDMIRLEPGRVRYHQKRVEYAVRAGDRSLLADAYFALAESLFRAGELEKSRAVYGRVLNLSPGDARARAALDTINDILTPVPLQEPDPATSSNGLLPSADPASAATTPRGKEPEPVAESRPVEESEPVDGPEPVAESRAVAGAEPVELSDRAEELAPVGEPDPVEPSKLEEKSATAPDFVNLADWVREDEPVRNTRMVVDVREPESQEQVEFAEMLSMFKQGVAANVDETDHESHYDLGVAYKEMGLLDEAVSEFQKALRGTQQRARAYEALGQCFVEKQQPQIAVTILSRALGDKNNTDDMLVGVLYLLGFASETLGRWADAQRFYERVYGVDIDFRDIGERLATVKASAR